MRNVSLTPIVLAMCFLLGFTFVANKLSTADLAFTADDVYVQSAGDTAVVDFVVSGVVDPFASFQLIIESDGVIEIEEIRASSLTGNWAVVAGNHDNGRVGGFTSSDLAVSSDGIVVSVVVRVLAAGKVTARDVKIGTTHLDDIEFSAYIGTGVSSESETPFTFSLNAYPNPFNPSTNIQYETPSEGPVTVAVVDAAGKIVAILFDGHKGRGSHSVKFNASGYESGAYLVVLYANGMVKSQKIVLVK